MLNDIYNNGMAFFADTIAESLYKKNFVALDKEQVKALALSDQEIKSLSEGNIITQKHCSENGDDIIIALFLRYDGFYYVGACSMRKNIKDFFEGISKFQVNHHFKL